MTPTDGNTILKQNFAPWVQDLGLVGRRRHDDHGAAVHDNPATGLGTDTMVTATVTASTVYAILE